MLFTRLAERSVEYFKKIYKAYIEVSLHTRKRQDKEGIGSYTTEIVGT